MDELISYLKNKYKEKLVSGYDDCNILLWGDKTKRPINILGVTLVVGVEISSKSLSNSLKDLYSENLDFRILYRSGRMIAEKAKIPYLIIAYFNNSIDENGFYINDAFKCENQKINSMELSKYLNYKFGISFDNSGTKKVVNKNTADLFHDWSRSHLSSNFTKVDIDGIFIESQDNLKIIEVKRSPTKAVGEWYPYYADATNYEMECELSKRIGCDFITLHHCEKGKLIYDETKISYFIIENVDSKRSSTEKDWITYQNETPINAEDLFK